MPTYAMNVFQLPNMWCADINTMIARFWWGAQNGNRKMHRRKWNTMIIQKREGGYGFRDLYVFRESAFGNNRNKDDE